MPGRHFLQVPRPTNIPDRILKAMHVAMKDHRSPAFPKPALPLFNRLKKLFKAPAGTPFVFPATGTGAREAVPVNPLSAGDRVLAPCFGQFSHLWIGLARRHGLEVAVQQQPSGTGASPEHIHDALAADTARAIKAVMVVQNETATGVTSDVGAVRRAIDTARPHRRKARQRRRSTSAGRPRSA